MDPFSKLAYDTACIEAHYSALYEQERRRYEEARDTWDTDLERALICTDANGF